MKKRAEDIPACRHALDLPEYMENRLSPEKMAWTGQHLQTCPICAALARNFRQIFDRLNVKQTDEPVEDLAPGILAQIPQKAWTRQSRRFDLSWYLRVAAVFVCLLAGGVFLWVRSDSPPIGEASIPQALTWLLETQEPDGHWDAARWGAQKNYTIGIGALALLACLKSDPSAFQRSDGTAIVKGLQYLVNQQNAEGRLGPLCSGTPYNHGLGTLALLEAYKLRPAGGYKEALDRALAYIKATQNSQGAWGYPRTPEGHGNTSITAWQVQALLKAEELGWTDARAPIVRAQAWLESVTDSDGRIGYTRPREFPNGHETLTAAGALCLMTGPSAAPSGARAKMIETVHAAAQCPDSMDYYRYYFLTRALRAEGSPQAAHLQAGLRQFLQTCQIRSGEHAGSYEPGDRWSSAGGRVYATAMAVLAMQ